MCAARIFSFRPQVVSPPLQAALDAAAAAPGADRPVKKVSVVASRWRQVREFENEEDTWAKLSGAFSVLSVRPESLDTDSACIEAHLRSQAPPSPITCDFLDRQRKDLPTLAEELKGLFDSRLSEARDAFESRVRRKRISPAAASASCANSPYDSSLLPTAKCVKTHRSSKAPSCDRTQHVG